MSRDDPELTSSLVIALQEFTSTAKVLQSSINENTIGIANVRSDVSTVDLQVNGLSKVIYGNGIEALPTRLARLEENVKSIKESLDTFMGAQRRQSIEAEKDKKQMRTALVTAVIAFVGSVAAAMMTIVK